MLSLREVTGPPLEEPAQLVQPKMPRVVTQSCKPRMTVTDWMIVISMRYHEQTTGLKRGQRQVKSSNSVSFRFFF